MVRLDERTMRRSRCPPSRSLNRNALGVYTWNRTTTSRITIGKALRTKSMASSYDQVSRNVKKSRSVYLWIDLVHFTFLYNLSYIVLYKYQILCLYHFRTREKNETQERLCRCAFNVRQEWKSQWNGRKLSSLSSVEINSPTRDHQGLSIWLLDF